ncbi:MAG: UDP-N-acetylmuramoyl-tripeptide--D-alanyl-D-alanine ligase [Patescibacteria group bacterium]
MKKTLIRVLAIFSRSIIKKYNPIVIGITGSVGKTSTKEVVDLLLSPKKRVRSNYANYNNEIGLPLTIIGEKSPAKNIFGWLRVFSKATSLILNKDNNYPEILVLEMGIDRPGDMDYLMSIVKPDRAILTNISHSHIEYFGSIDKIKKEKLKLLKNLKNGGTAIVNYDNKNIEGVNKIIDKEIISYGTKEGANLRAKEIVFTPPSRVGDLYGVSFKIEYNGSVVPVMIPNASSLPTVYSFLSAFAVAVSLGFSLLDLINEAKNFTSPKGRMNVLEGIKKSLIIDDTYNASPESSVFALDFLNNIKSNNRAIVVFGDMLELGHYSEEGHRLVGEKIARIKKINQLMLVGERARDIGRGAIENGFNKDNVFNFKNKEEAISFIKDRISESDIILVKGSQGARMEDVVKGIMFDQGRAEELLVRQSLLWKK